MPLEIDNPVQPVISTEKKAAMAARIAQQQGKPVSAGTINPSMPNRGKQIAMETKAKPDQWVDDPGATGDAGGWVDDPYSVTVTPEPKTEKAPRNLLGAAADVGRLIYDIPTQTMAAAGNLAEEDDPSASYDWRDRWREAGTQRAEERRRELGTAASERTFLPGVTRGDIAEASGSTGFSLASMGAGLAGGVAGSPVGPITAGAGFLGASGAAAYKMDKTMFTANLIDVANNALKEERGSPMTTEERKALLERTADARNNHALWEAGPEAVGNLLTATGIGSVFKGVGKRAIGKIVGGLAKMYGGELSTETVTQMGQQRAEVDAGLSKEAPREWTSPKDWGKSFEEIYPQTMVISSLMGGGAAVAGKAADALSSKQPAATPEPLVEEKPKTPIEQARADAEILKTGKLIPEADESRVKKATLIALYGENNAVRQAIEGDHQALIDRMLKVAPKVSQIRDARAQEETEQARAESVLAKIESAKAIPEDKQTPMQAALAKAKALKTKTKPAEEPTFTKLLDKTFPENKGQKIAAEKAQSKIKVDSKVVAQPEKVKMELHDATPALADKIQPDSQVFIIDQIEPTTGKFDTHKVVTGARGFQEAKELYDGQFKDQSGQSRRGAVSKMDADEFKTWLKGDTTGPVKYVPRETIKPESTPIENAKQAIETIGRDDAAKAEKQAAWDVLQKSADKAKAQKEADQKTAMAMAEAERAQPTKGEPSATETPKTVEIKAPEPKESAATAIADIILTAMPELGAKMEVTKAKQALDAAKITGKDRTDTIAAVRRGDLTAEDVVESHLVLESQTNEQAVAQDIAAAERARDEEAQAKKLQSDKDAADLAARTKARVEDASNFQFGESSKDAVKPVGDLFAQPAQSAQPEQPSNLDIQQEQAGNNGIMFSKAKSGEPTLIIQHNLSEENLLHADRMGGIPVPSLAITHAANPLQSFGDITLVGGIDMANPKGYAATKVFGADIYSPRYPEISHRLDNSALSKLNKMLAPYREGREIYGAEINSISDLTENDAFRKYAKEKIGETGSYAAHKQLAADMLNAAGSEERIFRGVTYSGNRKYTPHTLDNVVSILKKELRGGENFNYGVGNVRAAFTPQFKTIKQIQEAKGRLIGNAEFEKVKEEINAELFSLADKLVPYHPASGRTFGHVDTVTSTLYDAAKMGLPKAFKENGFDEVPQELQTEAAQFLNQLRNLPTEYFEAKILRAVDLSEFKGAVIPSDASQKVIDALHSRGVMNIVTYERHNQEDRTAKIQQLAKQSDLLFSTSNNQDTQVRRLLDANLEKGYTRDDAVQDYFNGKRIDSEGNKYTSSALYSEGQKPVEGMSKERVQRATAKLRMRWLGFRKINIVQSVKELPSDFKHSYSNVDGGVEGFYDPNTNSVYLIADNIATPERAVWVATHEVQGHGGLRMIDKTVADSLDKLAKNSTVAKLAAAIAKDRGGMPVNESTEEAFAELSAAIQTDNLDALLNRYGVKVPQAFRSNLIGTVNRVFEAIRNFIAKVMGKQVAEVTDAEVRGIINAARNAVEGKTTASQFEPGVGVMASNAAQARFYSQLHRAVNGLNDKIFQGTAANLKLHLMNNLGKYGIKRDELFWTGLEEFLSMDKKVSKADVLAFLDENAVTVKDEWLGDPTDDEIQSFLDDEAGDGYTWDEAKEYLRNDEGKPKFPTQVLPGGRDYKEMLITLPGKRYWVNGDPVTAEDLSTQHGRDAADRMASYGDNVFTSSHYPDHPNLIAHIRIDTRDDAQGRTGTFLEEQQSDWGIAASKGGFKPAAQAQQRAALENEQKEINEKLGAANGELYEYRIDKSDARSSTNNLPIDIPEVKEKADARDELVERSFWLQRELSDLNYKERQAVPTAPFVTSATGKGSTAHTLLSLKKVILHAIEQGHEFVSWTTGSQQKDRYSLSKQVDRIRVNSRADGDVDVFVWTKGAAERDATRLVRNTEQQRIPRKELADHIGKDAAEKALKEIDAGADHSVLEGLDLDIGGEWADTLYGNENGLDANGKPSLMSQAVKEVARQLGIELKVESVNIPSIDESYSGNLHGGARPDSIVEVNNGNGFKIKLADGKERGMFRHEKDANAELLRQQNIYDNGAPAIMQPGFRITDALRSKVTSAGMPLFSTAPKQSIIGDTVREQPPMQGNIPLTGGVVGSNASWDAPEPTMLDNIIYKLQDKNVDMKRVVEAIKSAGALPEKWNAYLQEELFHGRASKRTHDFVNTELSPLMDKMQGLTIDELDQYLHARHAKEANALIAERDPNMPDGGSGMTNKEASDYFSALPADKRKHLESIAAQVDVIIAKTRDLYVSYGLVSRDMADGWAKMFKHYVPLMREDKDGAMGIGQGFSIKGREVKHRTGSTKSVADIFANIALQREKVIVRGEKNRVASSLAGMVALNPNADFWSVGKVPTERVLNEQTGLIEERIDPMFKSRNTVVVAKIKDVNGNIQERAVIFNEDNERAVRMAEAIKNLDANTLGGILATSATITRYFASVNTQYNPVFGVTNIIRDVQGAALNLTATPLANHKSSVLRNIPSALMGIFADARAERKGHPATSASAKLWEELQDEGGMTGYRDLYRTSEDRANAIKHELNPYAWHSSKLGKIFTANGALSVPLQVAQDKAGWIFDMLSDYNLAMEGATRLSVYKVALEQGMSKQEAASLAKNITVNFNRKGQIGQQAGALYAFFNAAMQGTARIGQTVLTMENGDIKTVRLSKAGKVIVYGGVTLGAMQALALAAAGFDDDDPPEFIRERNLVIPIGGKKYISIPMPLGFHAIPNIGRISTEFAMGGFKNPADHVMRMMTVFAEAFNPIGNAGLSLQTIAPTPIDPLAALAENKDWTGKPIYKEDWNSMKPTPGFTRNKDTASIWSKMIAEGVNYITGGTEYTPGMASPTADQIDYLIGQVTGGVGREIGKAAQTVESVATGEDLPTYKVPLVGRFYGDSESQASQGNKYYTNLKRINLIEAELKGRREDKLPVDEFKSENPEYKLVAGARFADRMVQKYKKQKRILIENDAPREQIKAVEDRITLVMRRLNEAVATAAP